ncbi:hypothetical protein HOQ62_gp129 [Synechococcus phage ACG-2014f_Syn7803C8]|uniref:DUF6321 domain-containing protein n=1 Tax=Synechococcus phage ACG-2014f_Syn7803C8 TaxID=2790336 RepID=A0A0E3HB61_9CAUD|nr:hypothetical protein HOQ62_gp129 [Synechococcus phage ACG-2014f_Syn7803C8]AIX21453.1 hypothetical protein Syn7803C8_129 [Synechococcus phage ACG-2014f_Syn7803C8]
MGNLHKWFSGSKSKDGKSGWVNVKTGGTCASDEPGEGTPKCVSSSKRASMTKSERESASRRKKAADPGQQQKSGAAKPTYVSTDKPKKMKKEHFSNWRDDTPEPMVNELFGMGKKKEKKNNGSGGSFSASTAEANARSRGWKPENEKPKPMGAFGPEKGKSKSPDQFKNVKKALGIRPKTEPKVTSQTKPEPKVTSQTKTDPTPKSNPYSGKDKLKPQSFSTAVKSGTKMKKSTPSAPGKIVTQQGNQKEQFSNWRDNYVATEHEFIDLIKPEPMVGISETKQDGPEPTRKQTRGAMKNIRSKMNTASHKDPDKKKTKQELAFQKARAKAWGMTEEKMSERDKEVAKYRDQAKKKTTMPDGDVGHDIHKRAVDQYNKQNPSKKVKEEVEISEEDKKGSGSGKKDACYNKVKASASVWPSAYASGRLVQCRKKGAANYGKSKNEEFISIVASEYFINEGLNDEGVAELVDLLGPIQFGELVNEIAEGVEEDLLIEARAGGVKIEPKNKSGTRVSDLSKGARTRAINTLRKEKAAKRAGEGEGGKGSLKDSLKSQAKAAKKSEPKKAKKEEPKKEAAKPAVEKAKATQPKKRGFLDSVARQVNKGMDRHRKAMELARETGKVAKKAANIGGQVAKGAVQGVKDTAKTTKNVADKLKEEYVLVVSEEWKPDPTEKREKKAAKLGRDEEIEKGKSKKYGRDESKIDKLYKRRMAVQFKKKMSEERLDELKCWKGYKRKKGSTPGAPGSCVKEGFSSWRDDLDLMEGVAAWQRKEGKNKAGGLNEKGRKSYERENPGSDLKAPQPEGGPRKKSFCARMGGMKGPMKDEKGKPTRKALALRKWKC